VRRLPVAFLVWLIVMLCFFMAANLAGLVKSRGVQPFRDIGFPLTFATWKWQELQEIDTKALMLDTVIAIVVSLAVAAVCARFRSRGAEQKRAVAR
jgi:hypothetical protein